MIVHVWLTADGRRIGIKRLTNEHLFNILNQAEKYWSVWNENASEVRQQYFILLGEAARRGFKKEQWRTYKYRPLKDGDLKRQEARCFCTRIVKGLSGSDVIQHPCTQRVSTGDMDEFQQNIRQLRKLLDKLGGVYTK